MMQVNSFVMLPPSNEFLLVYSWHILLSELKWILFGVWWGYWTIGCIQSRPELL